MATLSLWKVVCCRDFVTPMDGRLLIIEGSSLLSFVTPMDGSLVITQGSLFVEIFFTPMDGSLVIMEGCLLWIFLLLQWMVALS